jgi:hypothetical protein
VLSRPGDDQHQLKDCIFTVLNADINKTHSDIKGLYRSLPYVSIHFITSCLGQSRY